jgi:NtrC-family two-component system sensor histidine kinase KinB
MQTGKDTQTRRPDLKENNHRASLDLLYHIGRELASALDLRTVLERVLFLSMRNVGAISGSIIVLDDNGKPVESAIITGAQVHNHTTQRLRSTLDRGLAGWVFKNLEPVLIQDTSQDERWMLRKYEDEEGSSPKSAVSAPLFARERMIGVMTLVHPQPGFFSHEHLELVQAIADQAGIAVLNARLYAESQRQARVMTALAESAATITASLNLEDVLLRIMEQISQALDVEGVSLALIVPEEDALIVRAATGPVKDLLVNSRWEIGQGIAGWVAKEGRGVIVQNAAEDERFDPLVDQKTGFKTHSVACAPLRYRGQIIGVLEAVNPKSGDFDPDALLVLTGIGSLAGTAVRHAQLFERLQAAHQSYRELFEDSIDPIFITDRDGKIMDANRQAVLTSDYDKMNLITLSISQVHIPDLTQLGKDYENLGFGKTLSYESRLRTLSGHEVPIQVYVRQVKSDGAIRIQWIMQDITERKNLDSMREDLLSMIYHDLRSPLANVVSSLDVIDTMLSAESDDPTYKSLLNIAMRSTERIQRLTNSLLDINRLEAGQPIVKQQTIEPVLLINEAVELIQPVSDNKNISLTTAVPFDLPKVFVDADMIRRVLSNLFENAAKFTPQGGKIHASVFTKQDWVVFQIDDTGPGIPASEHERIFEKFTRIKTQESIKGLGLGLAYCRLAVEGHGGKIWVESEPGMGSHFFFTLPAAPGESSL